jgi:hypothetical protein
VVYSDGSGDAAADAAVEVPRAPTLPNVLAARQISGLQRPIVNKRSDFRHETKAIHFRGLTRIALEHLISSAEEC